MFTEKPGTEHEPELTRTTRMTAATLTSQISSSLAVKELSVPPVDYDDDENNNNSNNNNDDDEEPLQPLPPDATDEVALSSMRQQQQQALKSSDSTSLNTNTTTNSSSGSGRFYAIRNWLKQSRWRKKSGKQTPPPPLPPAQASSAHNTPVVGSHSVGLFSSLFESHHNSDAKSASTILSKKGAKLKLKENHNASISSSGGGTGRSKANKKNDKLNNTIALDGQAVVTTPHKSGDHAKCQDVNSTPVSYLLSRTNNDVSVEVASDHHPRDDNDTNSVTSKCERLIFKDN